MPTIPDQRFDWRGGVNTSFNPDALDATELRASQNARAGKYGAIEKRKGTKRIHTDTFVSPVGMFVWDDPTNGRSVVVASNTEFYHKTLAATTFTEVLSTLTTLLVHYYIFAQHRIAGTATLYFADNGALRKWDGTTLTTSISGAPGAYYITVYKTRMFATDGSKTLYWSKIDAPETWSATSGGGQADVETYDSEGLVGLASAGSSLLLFKEDSIARYTGVTAAEIRIDRETEGVSNDVGCIAPSTIVTFEDNFVFFLSDRGAYIASEVGVQAIGINIECYLDDNVDTDRWGLSSAVHHKGRREIWMTIPVTNGNSYETWIYNYRLGSWWGPQLFTYNALVMTPYEKSDGTETVLLLGGGFAREADATDTTTDDLTTSDTGGTTITMDVELPELFFGDPMRFKLANMSQVVRADLGASGSLTFRTNSDDQAQADMTLASAGAGIKTYHGRPAWRGYGLDLNLREATTNLVTINGLGLQAAPGRNVT